MDEHLLTLVAIRVLEAWLLSLGLQPTEDDSVTITDYGPHRVFCVQARVPDGLAVDRRDLFKSLMDYLDKQAELPSAVRFRAYNIELYSSPVCGDYVFASIYHTA